MSKYLESWQSALDQVAGWKPRPGMPGNTHQQMLKEVAPPAGVSGGGVKKDDHFEKVKKIKDQINKQKDKVAKFDLGDPKQKTLDENYKSIFFLYSFRTVTIFKQSSIFEYLDK